MEQELIIRYKERLKKVYANPNPYYEKAIYEYSEIKEKIKSLEKIWILKKHV